MKKLTRVKKFALTRFSKMAKHILDYRFVRFLIVGCTNTAVSLITFAIAYQLLHGSYIQAGLAQALAFSVGTFWSYFWNRRWVFKVPSQDKCAGFQFLIVQFVLLIGSSVNISLAVDRAGVPPFLAWFLVMVVVTILNYFLLNLIVFKRPSLKSRKGNSA